jgi:hypothetical protein
MTIIISPELLATVPANAERPEGFEITDVDGVSYNWQVCLRCGGSGHYSFNLLDGTKCYGCHRACGAWVEAKVYARRMKDRARRAAKAAAARTARATEAAARAAEAQLAAEVEAYSMIEAEEARLAAKATRPAYPAGVQAVTGRIVSFKVVDNPYAYRATTVKVLIELEHGYRVFMTSPLALGDAEPGDSVEFTAEFEVSRNDAEFGFAKRPRKVRVLASA